MFHQPFYLPRMFERYTLTSTRFPSQSFDETGCDYFLFPTLGKKDHITVNIHYSLEHHTGITRLQRVQQPSNLVSRLSTSLSNRCKGYLYRFYVYVKIIYIDSSPDPEIFVPYVYQEPSDEFIWQLYNGIAEQNYISDY